MAKWQGHEWKGVAFWKFFPFNPLQLQQREVLTYRQTSRISPS